MVVLCLCRSASALRLDLQATLDERRQATVHKALLDEVVKVLGTLPSSALPHASQIAGSAKCIAALAESGSTDSLDVARTSNRMGCTGDTGKSQINPPVPSMGPEHLAWGGIDVVVFARHSGLLVTATADAVRVQYPPDSGPWCGSETGLVCTK